MSHEWKIGDWCELRGERHLVYKVNESARTFGAMPECGTRFAIMCNFNDCEVKHLPDCDSWDWQPPKPIEAQTEPQYRPFANAEEYEPFFDKPIARMEMGVVKPGAWKPVGYSDVGIYPDCTVMSYADAFKWYKFKDGTPFGVKEA